MTRSPRPAGITFIALFFLFGVTMSGLTVLLLLFPGTPFDKVWRLNPRAYEAFTSMGRISVVAMLAVCTACAIAALGLWRLRAWGFIAGLILLAGNAIGDLTNAILFRDWRTLIGVPIATAMAAYLTSRRHLFFGRSTRQ